MRQSSGKRISERAISDERNMDRAMERERDLRDRQEIIGGLIREKEEVARAFSQERQRNLQLETRAEDSNARITMLQTDNTDLKAENVRLSDANRLLESESAELKARNERLM